MERKIIFKGREGRFDEPSFILSENDDLSISFAFPEEIRIGLYRVVVRHGDSPKKTFTLGKEKTVTISYNWLKQGGTENVEFSICLTNVSGTAIIKDDYIVEPLKIRNVEGNFAATAVIFEMEERQKNLEERLQMIEKRFSEYENGGAELQFES